MKYLQKNNNKFSIHLNYKLIYVILTGLLVLSYISSLNGCATTEPQRKITENTIYKMNYEIVNVTLKNGAVIDLQNIPARYVKEYKEEKNVIVYSLTDTLKISQDSINISIKTEVIKIDEVQWVTIEKNRNFQIRLFY